MRTGDARLDGLMRFVPGGIDADLPGAPGVRCARCDPRTPTAAPVADNRPVGRPALAGPVPALVIPANPRTASGATPEVFAARSAGH
ncbi:hypothetical protein [Actinokineospora globicatena]|uniref:hypothetical protein n=1 Tax=Actinokineospora globicatena TaxID=103729 RepID=UPI0020A6061A|nr:hypothetical protein [Actinokineospora globicatena]MCP2303433.1 hypothetical protein [Actinokineospora globicatena]GLW79433.1 hypothetical protein Aglo01_39150 [Actinokineospora globicatena]GLW86157.1 hypothetical protein Aglo02_37960 [Actinokineospora globicatena]